MSRPPKITQVTHSYEVEVATSPVNIPGYVTRWVNLAERSKNWGIWSPLTRDGEFGDEAKKQLGHLADRFAGLNANSNLFYRGSDMVLAIATKEDNDELKRKMHEAAEARMKSIDEHGLRRNVIIPASEGFKSRFGG